MNARLAQPYTDLTGDVKIAGNLRSAVRSATSYSIAF
jgi:hypothetical protein